MHTLADQSAPRVHFLYFCCVCISLFVFMVRPGEVFPALTGSRLGLISFGLSGIAFFVSGGVQALRQGEFAGLKLMLSFLLLGFLIIVFSNWPRMAFHGWRTILLINTALFIFWLPGAQRPDHLKKIVAVIVLAAGSLVMAMLFASSVIRYKAADINRLSVGSTYDPNDIAMIIAVVIPFTLFLFRQAKLRGKVLWGGLLVYQVLGILSTGSRGGLLALGVACLLLLFTSGKNLKKWHRLFLVVLVAAFFISPTADTVKERWQEVLRGDDYNVETVEEGGVGRLSLWVSALHLVYENPVTGVGVTNSNTAMGERYGRWRALHNSYLQVALELGVGGFLLYLMILRAIWRNCSLARARFRLNQEHEVMEFLAVCTRVSLLTYMIAAFFLSQAYSLMIPILLLVSEGLAAISKGQAEGLEAKDI